MLYKVTHLWGKPKGEGHRKEKVLPDYDMVVIGSGFTGPTATLSALEATEKVGQVGGVALIEAGVLGTRPGTSRWSHPFMRLNRDNTLLRDRVERVKEGLSDLKYWRKLADETPNTVKFILDQGIKLIRYDEENAALEFGEPHFASPMGGGKEKDNLGVPHYKPTSGTVRHDRRPGQDARPRPGKP